MDPIKHVSFDCWNTILASNPEFSRKRAEFLVHYGISDSVEHIRRKFKESKKILNRIEQSTGRSFNSKQYLAFALEQLNVKIERSILDELHSEINAIVLQNRPLLKDDRFVQFFDTLKKSNISTNLASNTSYISGAVLLNVLRNYGIEFNFCIFSDRAGIVKPNPEIFDTIAYRSKCKKSEILHVGDDPFADYDGATESGLRSILIKDEINFDVLIDAIFEKSDHIGI